MNLSEASIRGNKWDAKREYVFHDEDFNQNYGRAEFLTRNTLADWGKELKHDDGSQK